MPFPIIGLSDADAAKVQQLLSDMAPSKGPRNGLVFLPAAKYNEAAAQVQYGGFGSGYNGGGERFGGAAPRPIGKGFSLVGAGRTYLSADLLKHPDVLRDTLAHELGHYLVGASEEAANAQRDVYVKRAQQAQKIDAGVQNLPVASGFPGALSAVTGQQLSQATPPPAPSGLPNALQDVLGGQSK